MAILLKILAILAQVVNTPLFAKVLLCIETQSGWQNILNCIMSATAPTPAEQTAKAEIVSAIQAHIANPTP